MVAHKYPQREGVQSSPANVQHYQIRSHARNNPHLSLPSRAETDRYHMMSDAPHTTVPLLFDNMMKTYLPSVDPDEFDAVYSTEMIKRIHDTFSTAVGLSGKGKKDDLTKEKIISQAWHDVHKNETLCPGYLLNISETKADGTDTKKYRIDGALIPETDEELVDEGRPNHMLGDLGIEFKRGGTENDAWDSREKKDMEADAYTRTGVRGQLMSYGERFFFFQHRTGLFMLLVNGDEFRIVRWDRSGCIVAEALNYTDTTEHTKRLLQFFYAFSKATPAQRGVDPTATRLSKDSCGWQWMQKVAAVHPQDIDHVDGTAIPAVPPGFIIKPTRTAPPSPLFATNVLTDDPAASTGFGNLSSSRASDSIIPVFKYVRDFFRESITGTWLPHRLKVCGRDYLIGEPIFGPHGLVGRGTRGYVALEWETQRLVFLKDAWRPFYDGVAQEGETLAKLIDGKVPFIPTLVCHEDVGGPGAQETEASQYSSTGEKKGDTFGKPEKVARAIAPMPTSRSKTSASGSGGSTASRTRQSSGSDGTRKIQRSSGSNGKRSTSAADSGKTSSGSGGHSAKRPRPQDVPPVAPKDGFGLRHLTHYRIVVAEVCLPSTEIKSGEQLSQVVWHCMTGHKEAVVKCGILHRDISAGNILIRPTVVCRESGAGMVLWFGVLSDWELAKALPDDKEVTKARQPHRTGTWYYMSVNSLKYPGLPLSIADELESFLHVIIYLAVRFLRTRSLNVWDFVDNYFEDFRVSDKGRTTCGYLKQNIIQTGSFAWSDGPIRFVAASPSSEDRGAQREDHSEVLSPINELIHDYLAFFKARYAVLDYEMQVAAEEQKPIPSLESVINAAASSSSSSAAADARAARMKFHAAALQEMGVADPSQEAATRKPAPATEKTARLEKPSQAVYDVAAKLATHDAILTMLADHFNAPMWSTDDYAGDQLAGYVPRALQSTAKRARIHLQSTMKLIPEGEEVPERPQATS
ncbi:hypothetical protein GSI_05119 [Ganoderma sinense ZZ0214-1]|uniref:Fungal-type protein kinase domain-containing protein n=1 Tax=Ganoderma sinense ZZ0214-1 TaxID=1077348 RepID=A0A2G8SFE3_9APHY|nr:hypothetical protein GSI_05119 [Ganoderma sinense ZZ0214-1]